MIYLYVITVISEDWISAVGEQVHTILIASNLG